MPPNPKQLTRQELWRRRDLLPELWRQNFSESAHQRLLGCLSNLPSANCLALTASCGSELDTWPIIRRQLDQGWRVVLPRITSPGQMEFYAVGHPLESLITNSRGISEPDPQKHQLVPPDEIDVMVLPGVGFDMDGHRLGQGGGYFDRYLARYDPSKRPLLVGMCFEEQIVPEGLSVEPHDIRVDRVVTQNSCYVLQKLRFSSNSVVDTHRLATLVAQSMGFPNLIRLVGPLGSGKTEWVRGFLHSLGWQGLVRSPSFALEKVYPLAHSRKAYHLDGYRLNDPTMLDQFRLEEVMDDPDGLVLVEWPERFGDLIPHHAPEIRIHIQADGVREIDYLARRLEDHIPESECLVSEPSG